MTPFQSCVNTRVRTPVGLQRTAATPEGQVMSNVDELYRLALGLENPRSYTRDLLVEPQGKPPILGSASSRYFGDDARYNPEDLMLASLGECHLLTYLALAAKAGIRVTGLSVQVRGTIARVEGKMRFREATLQVFTEMTPA